MTATSALSSSAEASPLVPPRRWSGYPALLAVPVAVAAFVLFAWTQGATPQMLMETLVRGVLGNPTFAEQTLVRAVPLVLASLAVVVPARAGMVNVGGEGQLVLGAVAATGVGVGVGAAVPGPLTWLLCVLAGALAGAAWSAMCGALRVWARAPEAVTTVLANFIAVDLMLFLLYQPWRDPDGSGQPQSRPLEPQAMLPMIPGTRFNLALVVAAVLVGLTWWSLKRTGWGFHLRITGGNPEAARRAGLPIARLSGSAMAFGGALAGVGGALNLLAVEGQLRPDITTGFGFVAFLAAFLAVGRVLRATLLAVLFAGIVVAGNPLQLLAGLDGSAVYVLLGSLCLGMAALSSRRPA